MTNGDPIVNLGQRSFHMNMKLDVTPETLAMLSQLQCEHPRHIKINGKCFNLHGWQETSSLIDQSTITLFLSECDDISTDK